MTTAMSRSDTCHCGPGHVEWKWECHPVAGLGEPCITSAQCHNHQVTMMMMITKMFGGTMHFPHSFLSSL